MKTAVIVRLKDESDNKTMRFIILSYMVNIAYL